MPQTFEVKSYYTNKSILITGCTGYLAKIILEKIARSCSDFKKIYVLMRVKQGVTLEARLQNEVLSSEMFNILYEKRPELRAVIKERVVAVQGDLGQENLGLDPKVKAHLIEDLDIIISSAASINFREHLHDALKTNYFGAVKILSLAHECKKLEVLSHVSTAFVGSNYPNMSRLNECIQPDLCKDDWEIQVKNLVAMDREEVKKNEEQLRWGYHNTYTYTKNLAERHLERYRGDLKIVINRPSGIIHCSQEPVPGWIDTVSAVGALAFPLGMGFSRNEFLPDEGQIDFIPGDYVSNAILATTAYIATQPKSTYLIYHNTSLTANPFPQFKFWNYAVEYLKYNPFDKQVREPRWRPQKHASQYEFLTWLEDDVPAKITEFFAKLPIIGSKSTLEQVEKFKKMRNAVDNVHQDIDYFKNHYWFYDCTELLKISALIDPKEAADWEFDPRKIDFQREGALMLYGIQRYYVEQDVPQIDSGWRAIMQLNHFETAHDLKFALRVNKIITQKSLKTFHADVLNPQKFQQFLNQVYASKSGLTKVQGSVIQLNQVHAQQQLKQIDTVVNKKAWVPMLVYMNRTFRNAFEGIFINDPGLDKVKTLMQKKQKVVLVPIYRSFLDLSLILYSLYANNIDFPFSFGNIDDVPTVALMDSMLSNAGYISSTRSRQQSLQESYISQAVLREVINNHPLSILFQNDIRIRSGKLSQPSVADIGILWLMQTYLTSMQNKGESVHVVPVSINYERVFEVRNLATEMVSGKVPRLSLMQLLNMLGSEKQGKLGRVFVNFGRQINLKEYLNNIGLPVINHSNIDEASLRLSEKLYKEQQAMGSVNLSQVIGTLLLQETGKTVGLRTILINCIHVHKYFKARRINSTITLTPTLFAVTKVIKKLGFKIRKCAIQPKGRNNEMEVVLAAKEDFKNELGLSYYSNQIMQSQILDCCVAFLLTKHFNTPSESRQPLTSQMVEAQVKDLYSILRFEFIEKLKQRPISESLQNRLQMLENMGEITFNGGSIQKVYKSKSTKNKSRVQADKVSLVSFFNKMGLHMMDTYLIVAMAVMEICNLNYEIEKDNLVNEIHKMIITMHGQSLIFNLQSCLKETISTALSRFVSLNLLVSKSHPVQNGGHTTYINSPIANKPKIDDVISKLMAFKDLGEEEFQLWGERISQAVEDSLVVFMSMGKL